MRRGIGGLDSAEKALGVSRGQSAFSDGTDRLCNGHRFGLVRGEDSPQFLLEFDAHLDERHRWQILGEFLLSGQGFLESRRQFGESVFGHAHWLVAVAERVFDDYGVAGLTEYDPYRRLVVAVAEQVIDRREIEVHFAGE